MTGKHKFVYLTDRDPELPTSGGMIRDSLWLKLLKKFTEFNLILTESHPPSLPHQFKRAWSKFRAYPENGYSHGVESRIRALFTPGAVIILSRLTHGKYIAAAKAIGYKVVLDEHNVEWLLNHQMAQSLPPSLYRSYLNQRLKNIEKLYCSQADLVFCTSKEDALQLEHWVAPSKIKLLPNLVNPEAYRPDLPIQGRPHILFAGTLDYYPNMDGIEWLIDEVLPWIKKKAPQCANRMVIAGRNPSPTFIKKLASASIRLVQNPPDMKAWFSESRLFIVPLRQGGGTRIKILEALASGCRVLSTTKGAEGLPFTQQESLWRADTPEAFADALIDLAGQEESFSKNSAVARRAVSTYCDLDSWCRTLQADLGELK